MSRPLLALVLAAFSALSLWSLAKVGFIGIWTGQFHPGGYQVLADLIILNVFAMVMIWQDAQRTGRNALPFLGITFVLFSFGPLLYWLTAPQSAKSAA